MKIAVSAVDASLDVAVDPRFGRCLYFVIVEAYNNEDGHKLFIHLYSFTRASIYFGRALN